MRLADMKLSPLDLAAISTVLIGQRFPISRRFLFGMIAVLGTLLFGASLRSLDLAIPKGFALDLTIVTGVSWIAFGLCTLSWTRVPLWRCADHCLGAMVVGEGILLSGALFNTAFHTWLLPFPITSALLNAAFVLAANLSMGAFLTLSFGRDGVPHRKTWLLWAFVLNGVAILAALILYLLKP